MITLIILFRDIVDWLIDKYPEAMNVRDNVSNHNNPHNF